MSANVHGTAGALEGQATPAWSAALKALQHIAADAQSPSSLQNQINKARLDPAIEENTPADHQRFYALEYVALAMRHLAWDIGGVSARLKSTNQPLHGPAFEDWTNALQILGGIIEQAQSPSDLQAQIGRAQSAHRRAALSYLAQAIRQLFWLQEKQPIRTYSGTIEAPTKHQAIAETLAELRTSHPDAVESLLHAFELEPDGGSGIRYYVHINYTLPAS